MQRQVRRALDVLTQLDDRLEATIGGKGAADANSPASKQRFAHA